MLPDRAPALYSALHPATECVLDCVNWLPYSRLDSTCSDSSSRTLNTILESNLAFTARNGVPRRHSCLMLAACFKFFPSTSQLPPRSVRRGARLNMATPPTSKQREVMALAAAA